MATARGYSEAAFQRLKPGDRLVIRPSIPRSAERHEHQIAHLEAGLAVIGGAHGERPLSIPSSSVAELQTPAEGGPSVLVLRGRLQWITADRAWVLRSEKPAPESEYGIEKPASPEDPHVMSLLERLRRAGCSPWWVPQEGVQEFLNQGGEVVYDEDGRYLRTKRERSEWILLGRRGQGLAVGA